MSQTVTSRELVKQHAASVLSAADELRHALQTDDMLQMRVSVERVKSRTDDLKTELAVLHRVAPDQEF